MSFLKKSPATARHYLVVIELELSCSFNLLH